MNRFRIDEHVLSPGSDGVCRADVARYARVLGVHWDPRRSSMLAAQPGAMVLSTLVELDALGLPLGDATLRRRLFLFVNAGRPVTVGEDEVRARYLCYVALTNAHVFELVTAEDDRFASASLPPPRGEPS